MSSSTFRFQVAVPKEVTIEGQRLSREEFFDWVWRCFAHTGLLGVHEGTLLSEEAAEQGFETESWTVDSAEAPRERDWVEAQTIATAELYFNSLKNAQAARGRIESSAGLKPENVIEQKPEDWDAKWKASFLNAGDGFIVRPFWRVLPPWTTPKPQPGEQILRINPGAGFGTGTHETTQLCLQAIGENAPFLKVLDFGSGSGILTIAAAALGAQAVGVEIDPLAIENAHDNARLNGLERKVVFQSDLTGLNGKYDLVIANILKPVLLEFASKLCERRNPERGRVILSGLIDKDVEPVSAAYTPLIGYEPEVRALNEWRALVWSRA